ncbi:LytR C-terminal domain-containing protein [Angustibacter aerolatus]
MSDPSRARTGAHRPRRSPLAVLVPLALAVAAVVALLVAVGGLLGGGDVGDDTPTASATTKPVTTTRTTTPATTPVTSAPVTSAPAPSTPASSTPASSSSSSTSSAAVDRSARVSVLNSTRTAGLAAKAAATLRTAGWAVSATGNYRQATPPTTVYYPGDLEATARAVAADLGRSVRVQPSSQFGTAGLTVVLGADFSG